MQFDRRNPASTWRLMAEMLDTTGVRSLLEDAQITDSGGMVVDVTVNNAQLGSPDQTGGANYATLRFPLTIRYNS